MRPVVTMRVAWRCLLASAAVTLALACGTPGAVSPRPAIHPFVAAEGRPTCIVLSVGGAQGLSHLGALRGVQASGLDVDCVIGNSMGALAGGLYASDPATDPVERYRAFASAYVARTEQEATERGILGFLLGAGAVALTGGAAAPALAAGVAAGGLGVATTAERDLDRTIATLDALFESAEIEGLGVGYTTYHHVAVEGGGVELSEVSSGNLAAAIGKSIANPLLFPGFDAVASGFVDPGSDRVAAVPVQDACTRHSQARLLVLNVTDHPAFYRSDLGCPILEVRIEAGEISREAMLGRGDDFERAIRAGEDAVRVALARVGVRAS